MRVSSNTFPNQLKSHLETLNQTQLKLQKQLATGQKLEKVSDNPAKVSSVRYMQVQQKEVLVNRHNLERAETTLNFVETTASSLHELNRNALNTIGLLTGAEGATELNQAADQVDNVLEQAVSLLSERINDQYVFSASSTSTNPFEIVRDVDGKISSVTYVGGTSELEYSISQGVDMSPFPSPEENMKLGDWLNSLVGIRESFLANDSASITTNGQALEAAEDDILLLRANLGSKAVQMEFVRKIEDARFNSLENEIASATEADVSQTVLQLNTVQSAYQGALQSASRIMNFSLLDFI